MGLLGVRINRSNRLITIKRHFDLTASSYMSSQRNTGFERIIRLVPKGATILIVLLLLFPAMTSVNPYVGIFLSVGIFLLLMIEFLLFRPKIFNILRLPASRIHSLFAREYPAAVASISDATPINRWITFYRAKEDAANALERNLISRDALRLHCFMRILLRTLVLLACYSAIIMFADSISNGGMLCSHSECETHPAHSSDCTDHIFTDYLYKSFSLFLSVSAVSALTATNGGILLLLGQILIYFAVLIVVIGRISDNISMYSNQIDNVAHNAMISRLNM
jgi:hypothetical protein